MPRYDPSLPPCGHCAGCNRCGSTDGPIYTLRVSHADGRPCGLPISLCGECRRDLADWLGTRPAREVEPKGPARMAKIPD